MAKIATKPQKDAKTSKVSNATRDKLIVAATKTIKINLFLVVLKNLLDKNKTTTSLEVKEKLREVYPDYYWAQDEISENLAQLAVAKKLEFTDNGPYRTYFYPVVVDATIVKTPKKAPIIKGGTISRTKAFDLIKNNKGHFFTATFQKKGTATKPGELRTINCQYMKDQIQTPLGMIKVKEAKLLKANKNSNTTVKNDNDSIRTINLQTLTALIIKGTSYKVK